MLKGSFHFADESLRPMALFTNHLCRTWIVGGDVNRPVEVVPNGVIELLDPVQFRLEIGGCSWPDMT